MSVYHLKYGDAKHGLCKEVYFTAKDDKEAIKKSALEVELSLDRIHEKDPVFLDKPSTKELWKKIDLPVKE